MGARIGGFVVPKVKEPIRRRPRAARTGDKVAPAISFGAYAINGCEPTEAEIAENERAKGRPPRRDGDRAAAVGMVSILGEVIAGGLPVPCSQAGRP
jgi:hypothetical protein